MDAVKKELEDIFTESNVKRAPNEIRGRKRENAERLLSFDKDEKPPKLLPRRQTTKDVRMINNFWTLAARLDLLKPNYVFNLLVYSKFI